MNGQNEQSGQNRLSGIIIINKPTDWTSHDVVARLRSILKMKRIGHGGTLDPLATGVLPIFVGRATRASEFSENADKEYIAELQFGVTTDTQDITGNVLNTAEPKVTTEDLYSVIPQFLYEQKQIPPMYSAIKINGKKLYELARRGEEVKRPPRDIYISELEYISHFEQSQELVGISDEPNKNLSVKTQYKNNNSQLIEKACLRVICSKGTYIRTLCHDIGNVLGCGAVMSNLQRTRAGNFKLEQSYTIEEVAEAALNNELQKIIKPVDILFENYPALHLDDINTKKCKNGTHFFINNVADGKYRVYSLTGEFLALSESKNNAIKPIKSFFEPI